MFEFQLKKIPQGGVRCVFTDEPWSFWRRHLSPETLWPDWRYAVWGLPTDFPINWSIDALLDNSLHQLARLAVSIWPYWYGDTNGVLRHTATATQIAAIVQKCHFEPFLKTPPEGIYLPWLKAARKCCISGRLPLLPRYARTVQAYQLALALAPADLLLLVICDTAELCAGDLRNLGRSAEWVAAHTQARLLQVLPFEYRNRTELDSVNYQALMDVAIDGQVNDIAARMPDSPEESSHLCLGPIIGRPHPFSEGEQLLSRALATDARLCHLFEYNAWVEVRSGRRFEDDFELREVGYTWLQGLEVDVEDQQRFGLRRNPAPPADIIKGLSWLMGLMKPTLLAFDQVDNIVSNHMHLLDVPDEESVEPHYEASRRRSLTIIEGLAGGLMALWDNLSRTLMLAVCTDNSWDILEKNAFRSTTDRFHSPLLLNRLPYSALAEDIVERRLANTWQAHNITPPYPSWPFASSFFTRHGDWFPRDLLKACDRHRNFCCQKGLIVEIFQPEDDPSSKLPSENLPDPRLKLIDDRFRHLLDTGAGNTFVDEDLEDIIRLVCQGLRDELILPENIDAIVDQDFNYRKSPVLHARLRLIYRQEGDREDHYAIRALQKTHHTAFQSRLKAAVTASGIDGQLPFRHLLLLRTKPLPTGKVTEQRLAAFKQDGGVLHWPNAKELQTLAAVALLVREAPSDLAAWLRIRRPLSGLPLFQQTGLQPFLPLPSKTNADEGLKGTAAPVSTDPPLVKAKPEQLTLPKTPPLTPPPDPPLSLNKSELPLGHRLLGHQPLASQTLVTIPLHLLRRHTVILAGAGSGKTVLIRRLVEEAALRGIPSLVIDAANDLSRLGKPWPEAPEGWLATDAHLARRYFEQTETLIWTPGIQRGNPLYLDPLPNLAAVADDADMLQQVISSAHSNLAHLVAPGNSAKAKNKQGVLVAALMYFAQQGLQGLEAFIDLLSDLPPEAGGGISQAAKLADDMANQLKSERLTNVLWQQAGERLDPAVLLGLNQPSVTRISVINLAGIPQLEHQQQFMAQFGTLLFVWLKKHPASDARPLQGLLIIDEAKDFVPAGSSTPCKDALLRLAAQARKYGMGLIFASQAPKSIDHNVVANCTTQFYGRTNSPAAIETVKNLLQEKGGSGHDVATLSAGQFYVHSEGFKSPRKIRTPLCLSWHSASPPLESEVHTWAAAARTNL